MGEMRAWLDDNLFPEEPQPPALTPRRGLAIAAIALAATGIQLLRMWSSLPLQSIWAEDGSAWLNQALNREFLDALTSVYNGYLQSVGRLVAEPVSYLPVEAYAPVMAITGAAIVTGCAFIVWRASAGHIETWYLRGTLAALVVLLPVLGVEMLANVTNSNWFMLFAAFWLLFWRPASLAAAAGAAALLFLAAIGNIGIVFLIPVWLLRLVVVRDRQDALIVGGFALGLAIQIAFFLPAQDLPAEQAAFFQANWDWNLVPAYAQRVIAGALVGHSAAGFLWESLGWAMVVALGLALIAYVLLSVLRARPPAKVFVPVVVAVSVAFFLISGYKRWLIGGSTLFWPEGTSAEALGDRYVVVPALLLLSAFFVTLDRFRGIAGTASAFLKPALPILVLAFALSSFSIGDEGLRGNLTWTQALADGRAACALDEVDSAQVKVAPPIYFAGFRIDVPCSKLNE